MTHEIQIYVHRVLLGQSHTHFLSSLATLASVAESSRGSKSTWPAELKDVSCLALCNCVCWLSPLKSQILNTTKICWNQARAPRVCKGMAPFIRTLQREIKKERILFKFIYQFHKPSLAVPVCNPSTFGRWRQEEQDLEVTPSWIASALGHMKSCLNKRSLINFLIIFFPSRLHSLMSNFKMFWIFKL